MPAFDVPGSNAGFQAVSKASGGGDFSPGDRPPRGAVKENRPPTPLVSLSATHVRFFLDGNRRNFYYTAFRFTNLPAL